MLHLIINYFIIAPSGSVMDGEDSIPSKNKKIRHLSRLSTSVLNTSNALSQMFEYKGDLLEDEISGFDRNAATKWNKCPYCCHKYDPARNKFRLVAKETLTKNVSCLLKKYEQKKTSLGRYQLHMIERYLSSENAMKITCSRCGKTKTFPGQTRDMRKAQRISQCSDANEVTVKTRKEKRKELKKKIKHRKKIKTNEDNADGISMATDTLKSGAQLCGGVAERLNVKLPETSPSVTQPSGQLHTTETPASDQGHFKVKAFSRTDQGQHKDKVTWTERPIKATTTFKANQSQSKVTDTRKRKTGQSQTVNTSFKRLKSKSSHQQLSQMLAQQQTSSQEHSLKDFLSTL